MRTQLRRLVFLQEIDALLADLESGGREIEESLGFPLAPLATARARRAETARAIDREILRRYEQVRQRHARPVAAEREGVCMGCFTVRPTRSTIGAAAIETCERCGRILFRIEGG